MIQYTLSNEDNLESNKKIKNSLRKFFHNKQYYYHFINEGICFFVRLRKRNKTFERYLIKEKIKFKRERYSKFEGKEIKKYPDFYEYCFNFFCKKEFWKMKRNKKAIIISEIIERLSHILSLTSDLSLIDEGMILAEVSRGRNFRNGELNSLFKQYLGRKGR